MSHSGIGKKVFRPFLFFVMIAGAMLAGCGKNYILVKVDFGKMTSGSTAAEVSQTASYRSAIDKINVLSIRLPDQCTTESAARMQGNSNSSDVLMMTSCAVWLGELERALVTRGYRVVSWDAIYRLERTRNVSTYVAAQELGIDAIILINSLEVNQFNSGGLSEASISYLQSNPDGEDLGTIELPTRTRNAIKGILENTYHNSGDTGGLRATMDSTVVYVRTGEAIWFFRRNITSGSFDSDNIDYLFRGRDIYYRPVTPKNLISSKTSVEVYKSSEVSFKQRSDGSEDQYKHKKLQLIREVTNDFVNRFKSGVN